MRLTLTPATAPPDGARLRALGWDVEPELDYDATAPVVLASLEALWREARRDSCDYSDHDVAGFLPPPPAVERAYVAVAPRVRCLAAPEAKTAAAGPCLALLLFSARVGVGAVVARVVR